MTGRSRHFALLLAAALGPATAQDAPGWADVAPLLADRCTMCHSGEDAPLGLRLDSFEGVVAGSDNGPVLVPGDPGASELIRRVRGHSQPAMPLGGDPLSERDITLLERWIVAGMPGDVTGNAASETSSTVGPAPGEPVTFVHVEPIFLRRCAVCHTDGGRMGAPPEGLRLDGYEPILRGGERLVLVPGRPEASAIVRHIEGTAEPRMPLDGPPWLTDEEIRLVRDWIAQGARDANGNSAPMPVGRELRLRGRMTGENAIDGASFVLGTNTRVDDQPTVGQGAEMRGEVQADGTIRAMRLRAR